MKNGPYLFDTHALLFWVNKINVSEKFIKYFDDQERKENVLISAISFWEIALLVKKKRIDLENIEKWKNEIFSNTNLKLANVDVSEMIKSTLLPDLHKDPFDRLLIAQAVHRNAIFVTKDKQINKYELQTFWID